MKNLVAIRAEERLAPRRVLPDGAVRQGHHRLVMADATVNKDGSVTFSTDAEHAGPTGAVVHDDGAVTHYFDGVVPDDAKPAKKAVQSSENKSAAGKASSK